MTPTVAAVVPAAAAGLTVREIQVLTLVAEGKSNGEIAGLMFLAPDTVRTHLMRIGAKLGMPKRTGMVGRAYQLGILQVPVAPKPAAAPLPRDASVAIPLELAEVVLAVVLAASEGRLGGDMYTRARRAARDLRAAVCGARDRANPAGASGALRASQTQNAPASRSVSVSVALRPLPAAIPPRPSGADVPQPTNGAPA